MEQCRYLEGVYGTDFTGKILDSKLSRRDLQKAILTADKAFRLKDCDTHQSLKHITGPGIPSELSWLKVWDIALDHGARGTKAALSFFSALSRPVFGNRLQGCIQDFLWGGRGGTHISVASRGSGGMLPQKMFCILRWTLT